MLLDSSISDDDPGLALDGYNLLRCDHPSNTKQDGACIYYKNNLPLSRKSSLTQLDECIVCEFKSWQKKLFCYSPI